jgi:predicted NUDIX family NTP pyrophosphohydrolase
MTRVAAGLLPFAWVDEVLEVFIVHPGGPYFTRQDEGIWSIAKGLLEEGEAHESAALREFEEEVGVAPPPGPYIDLGEVKLRSGKVIHIFAVEAERSLVFKASNEFELEWPRGSGVLRHFPEVDRAEWFGIDEAYRRLLDGQHPFLERLIGAVDGGAHRDGVPSARLVADENRAD